MRWSAIGRLFRTWLLLWILLPSQPARSDTWVWVDDQGTTHLTGDLESIPPEYRDQVHEDGAELRHLWGGDLRGPDPGPVQHDSSRPEDRARRLLRGAVEDLRRGESARASLTLHAVLRDDPTQASAHWYLALLERQRGHFEQAAEHLRAFLTHAGDDLETWRDSARRRLASLEDEQRLVDPGRAGSDLQLIQVKSSNFRVQFDEALGESAPDYAQKVIRYLEDAHSHLVRQWGTTSSEPTGVVLYSKAAYVRAHSHRFSFETVGFFDGRIHVVSAAHPAGELRSLLFHEYTHALFRERTGGDRPYWLNEGLAEIAERASRQEALLSRGERIRLRDRIRQGRWIPLRRLAPSFAGLEGEDARDAYTESTAAALWLLQRTDSHARARMLAALARAENVNDVLREAVGIDQEALGAALRQEILAEFPGGAAPGAALR